MPLDDTQLFDAPPPGTIQPQNPDYVPAYQEQPAHWRYDLDPISGVCRASYSGIVFAGDPANAGNQVATKADIAASTTGVASFNAPMLSPVNADASLNESSRNLSSSTAWLLVLEPREVGLPGRHSQTLDHIATQGEQPVEANF